MEERSYKIHFDMYSKRTNLFYKNQEKIGSFFGLFLSLAYIIISIFLFFNEVKKILERTEL